MGNNSGFRKGFSNSALLSAAALTAESRAGQNADTEGYSMKGAMSELGQTIQKGMASRQHHSFLTEKFRASFKDVLSQRRQRPVWCQDLYEFFDDRESSFKAYCYSSLMPTFILLSVALTLLETTHNPDLVHPFWSG